MHIFAIPLSSRLEKCCRVLERLFVVFHHSRNILCPGSTIKKLKKAALIGSGVYSAYKLAKAQSKFAKFDDPDIDFNTWNTWREVDGFLCKTDNHCNWLDENFECQQVGEFGWTVSADVSFIESIFESFYSVKYCNVNYSVK